VSDQLLGNCFARPRWSQRVSCIDDIDPDMPDLARFPFSKWAEIPTNYSISRHRRDVPRSRDPSSLVYFPGSSRWTVLSTEEARYRSNVILLKLFRTSLRLSNIFFSFPDCMFHQDHKFFGRVTLATLLSTESRLCSMSVSVFFFSF